MSLLNLQSPNSLSLLLLWQVPMFSASGLQLAYLKIQERKMGSAYKVDKWVRKVVKSGDYLIRT